MDKAEEVAIAAAIDQGLAAVIRKLQAENDEYKAKANIIVCAFCGHEAKRDMDTIREDMANHIATCEDHPMRKAVLELQTLKYRWTDLIDDLNILAKTECDDVGVTLILKDILATHCTD